MDWRVFSEIPEDYSIKTIMVNGNCDLNSIEVFHNLYMKGLLKTGIAREADGRCIISDERKYNGDEYSEELFSFLAKEYIDSALVLAKCVLEEREGEVKLSSYANPCSFLCRHAIELKIKQCLCHQHNSNSNSHTLKTLWDALDKTLLEQGAVEALTSFIEEVSCIDEKGIAWRYGTDKDRLPIKKFIPVDCCMLTQNTMFLFNQLHRIAY